MAQFGVYAPPARSVLLLDMQADLLDPLNTRVGGQQAMTLHLSAVGAAELRRGAAILPDGRRRDRLLAAIDAMIAEDFAGRVLPFDSAAAMAFAAIFTGRRNAGRPISFPDCQIATTARAHGAAMATRNVADFDGCGVEAIDPWAHTGGT